MKDLTFKLRRKVREVTILNEKDEEVKYNIFELVASVREKYMDKLSQRLQLDPKGNIIGLKKYDGMQTDLLVLCMKTADGKPVEKATLDSWPSSTVTALFHAAQAINALRKEDTRNQVFAEQVVKHLEEVYGVTDVAAEEIEKVIETAEKNLYAEADADGDATNA